MEAQILILVVSFITLLCMNVPVAIAIGLSTFITILSVPDVPATYTIAQRMSTGISSFPLLAIPFFIMAGILMGDGGMARRLIDFAALLVGRFNGGLAYVSTLTCMLFGAISGSATAAVSSVGGMMIPEMKRKGYDKNFSVAVTTTAATTGLLIPPSKRPVPERPPGKAPAKPWLINIRTLQNQLTTTRQETGESSPSNESSVTSNPVL